MSTGWQKFKGFFKGPSMPSALTENQLYSGPRAFGDYRPEAATAGAGAYNTLRQVSQTGWTGADRGAFAAQQRQAAAGEQAQRGAIMQDAAARGQASGGLQFAGALAAQQGGANRAQEAGAQQAMAGADRRLGASQAMGQMDMQRAGATDQFNQWATGAQTNAVQGAYDSQMGQYAAKAARRQQMFSNIANLAGSATGTGMAIRAARRES